MVTTGDFPLPMARGIVLFQETRISIYFGGNPYYFYNGFYYGYYGGYYEPIFPPIGLRIGFLPYGYTSLFTMAVIPIIIIMEFITGNMMIMNMKS